MLVTNEKLNQPEVVKYGHPLQLETSADKEVLSYSFPASFQNAKINLKLTIWLILFMIKNVMRYVLKNGTEIIVLHRNRGVEVICRVNIGPLSKRNPVLFQPEKKELWPEGLETLGWGQIDEHCWSNMTS